MELKRNLPGNLGWEGSFYEQLTENGEWNNAAFNKLLQSLSELKKNKLIETETVKDLLSLQGKVLNLVAAHFNQKDVYKITNLDTDAILDNAETLTQAIIEAVKT